MSTVVAAIAALKTALADIDPSPQPVPAAIYEWELDYATMDYTTFPFIIVAEVVNRDFVWQPASHGVGYHRWEAEILTCLTTGPLTRAEAAASAETKHKPWLLALAKVLFGNQGLGGAVLNIGAGQNLFTYRVGNQGWDGKIFWGVRCIVPVRQLHSLPTS